MAWAWVAGFFDGEGSISLYIRKCSIDLQVIFTQAYKALLDELSFFLTHDQAALGIRMAIKDKRNSAYSLYVSSNHDVCTVLTRMLPHLRLKQIQAKATIDYLSNFISGDRLVEIFNTETIEGRRRGKIRPLPNLGLTRREEILSARRKSLSVGRKLIQARKTESSTSGG